MKNGFKVIDMDTHVNPGYETLIKYLDPSFRPRLAEIEPYVRKVVRGGVETTNISVAAIPYDRFPGEAPKEEDIMTTSESRGALTGRVTKQSGHHRLEPQPGTSDENVEGRIKDMDLEGRDLDFIFPGTWATTVVGIPDPTLAEGLWRGYHNYMHEYTSQHSDRLHSMLLLAGADVEWSIAEVKKWSKEPWVGAAWIMLPENVPIDHPKFDPLFEVLNEEHMPITHHSFFFEPPYFPGYRDIWGNAAVARTAAHPWGAARLLSYLIVGKIFDRYPNIRACVAEVGNGWLPHWVIRLGEMINYVSGTTPPLDYKPIEYVQMGRFMCGAEPMEGPAMTKACYDILGDGALLHQSDYPHGEAHFPDTADMIINWPCWKELPDQALLNHMALNAEKYFGQRL